MSTVTEPVGHRPGSASGHGARLAAVVAAGAVGSVVLAAVLEMTPAEGMALAVPAATAAAVAGGLGALVLGALRRARLGVQLAVVAVTAVASVAAGALAAARAMFFSTHDLHSLAVVLVAATAVALASSMILGRRVSLGAHRLGEVAAGMADGSVIEARGAHPGAGELEALAARLADTSRRLDQARRHERALESSRRELVAWVSHDLRTPLAAIRAVVEALEDRVVTDPTTVARYHQTLRREADRLAELVDDLFELSRLQSGSLALQIERACLADLVSDAVAASTPAARAKGVRLEGRVSGHVPDLDLSSAEVARALRNLLENAIRHTPSDGSVVVNVDLEDDRAVVSVADGCGGIPAGDIDRVFEPAFRGEAARTPAGSGGAGLGLAIVRGIVEAHDGEVAVTNAGQGCRFVLRLPLVRTGPA